MPDAPRVLVIRRRYLGDVVLLGPIFRNLRLHWPGAEITALVEQPYTEILGLNPDVARTLAIPRSKSPKRWLDLVRELRRGRFTYVLDLDNTEKTAVLARVTRAPYRIKLQLGAIPEKFPSFYTASVFVSSGDYDSRPIGETHLRILTAIHVPVVSRETRLIPRTADVEYAEKLLPRGGQPARRLLIHPGSRSAFRVWPVDRFAAIAERAYRELGAHVALIGGPGETKLIEEIRMRTTTPLVVPDKPLSTTQFAAFASRFDTMLCHDSGPMHVAAAVGTPVVALFGSQEMKIWRPSGTRHVVLQPPLPCVNCVAPSVCVPNDSYRNYCVQNIPIDAAWKAVKTQLNRCP